MELKFEGRMVKVMIGDPGHASIITGQLEAWDPDLKVLIVQASNDNGVLTDRRDVINWDKVMWFSITGPVTVEEKPNA